MQCVLGIPFPTAAFFLVSISYGRKLILFVGLTIFAIAAMMIAGADTLAELVGWRIVQGIGGAFCAVSVPAIVRDQVGGQEAARLFGLIGLIGPTCR